MSSPSTIPDWSTEEYWQGRFIASDTPWQLNHPSSVLREALEELAAHGCSFKGQRVLVPGSGRGLDALELAEHGCSVVAIDWSAAAIAELTARCAGTQSKSVSSISVIQGDFFRIDPQPVDIVAEHTFFCALAPQLRGDYVKQVAAWMKPGGYLVGDFFVVEEEVASGLPGLSLTHVGEGPPFAVSERELRKLFAPFFSCHALRPAKHPEPDRRPGLEWVGIFRRA